MHSQEFSGARGQPSSVRVQGFVRHNVGIIAEIVRQAEGMAQFVGCYVKPYFAINYRRATSKATIFPPLDPDSSDLTAIANN